LPFSHDLDRQPIFKFYMHHNGMYMYFIMSKSVCICASCVCDSCIKPKNSDWLQWP
jgi:hypothetical protein